MENWNVSIHFLIVELYFLFYNRSVGSCNDETVHIQDRFEFINHKIYHMCKRKKTINAYNQV